MGRPCLLLGTQEKLIVYLAVRGAIPVLDPTRDYALAGGLMSYGTDFRDSYRQCGIYAGRVIRGEKPADLPVQLSTKFEFVVNLKAVKALGLSVPNSNAIAGQRGDRIRVLLCCDCSRPVMAHRVISLPRTNSAALRRTRDRRAAAPCLSE